MTRFATRLMSQRARRAVDERGVTLIIFGLVIVALLAIVAIVVDLGNARQQKRQLQNAADAAALAGASAIANQNPSCSGGDMVSIAAKYVYNNMQLSGTPPSCPTSGQAYTVGDTALTITTPWPNGPAVYETDNPAGQTLVNVKVCRDVATTFAKVIGFSNVHVCGNATAHKAGVSTANGSGNGTGSSDPDAPCTEDNFIPTKYFPGGSPGAKVADGNTIGATFGVTPVSDGATLDFVNRPPKFLLNGVAVNNTKNPIQINGKDFPGPGPFTPKANVTVNGVTYHNVFEIKWHISDPLTGNALPDNARYTVQMSAYDTDQDHSPAGDCGKAQWAFTKGTVSSGGTSPCDPGLSGVVEDSFLGSLFPAQGTIVSPGHPVGATFQDESPIYNPNDPTDKHNIVFQIDGNDISEGTNVVPDAAQGPNTVVQPSANNTSVYTLTSPSARIVPSKEKYSTDIQYLLPQSLSNGAHTITLKAWDTDSNKSGGDCGTATWTINVTGGRSDVELVQ